jgi:hypothetical protein
MNKIVTLCLPHDIKEFLEGELEHMKKTTSFDIPMTRLIYQYLRQRNEYLKLLKENNIKV